MLTPIIHIGFPKTGTTWFQKHYYPTLNNCRYFSRKEVTQLLINVDALTFNHTNARREFERLAEGKRIVICEELLLGGLDIPFGNGEFVKIIADRLLSVFPDATIVIFIRNQVEILASAYFQYIRSGGTYRLNQYLRIKERFKPFYKNWLLFTLNNFKFTTIIDYYCLVFPKDKIKVYLYEDFKTDPTTFLHNLRKDLTLEHNSIPQHTIVENLRFSKLHISVMRFANHFSYLNTARKNFWVNIPYLYYNLLTFMTWSNRYRVFNPLRTIEFILGKNRIDYINRFYTDSNQDLRKYISEEKLEKYNYIFASK